MNGYGRGTNREHPPLPYVRCERGRRGQGHINYTPIIPQYLPVPFNIPLPCVMLRDEYAISGADRWLTI